MRRHANLARFRRSSWIKSRGKTCRGVAYSPQARVFTSVRSGHDGMIVARRQRSFSQESGADLWPSLSTTPDVGLATLLPLMVCRELGTICEVAQGITSLLQRLHCPLETLSCESQLLECSAANQDDNVVLLKTTPRQHMSGYSPSGLETHCTLHRSAHLHPLDRG